MKYCNSDNALDLDKPIHNYLPSLGPQYHSITTRQLAGHLAGIRHYKDGDLSDLIRSERFASAIDALKVIKNDSLLFGRYHYSSYGWNIVGAVIEATSGQSYLDYMSQNIWKPWGLKNIAGATMENLEINCRDI